MTAEGNMVDEDVDAADALARLEAALDRIAEGSRPGLMPQSAEPASAELGRAEPVSAELAERLDSLIAQLRDALERDAPDRDVLPTEG